MRKTITAMIALLALLGIALPSMAQQRLSRDCRVELRELCGTDRSAMRACLRENWRELSSTCRAELRERMGNRGGGERRDAASRENAPLASLAYGDHARQAVDFYTGPVAAEAPPLVLFVHGGAWSFGERSHVQTKPSHFAGQGYAFASAGYRVLPDVSVEEQASDLAAALSAIRADAPRLGFDPDRIVLMGHSAGAHLAALVATDPAYAGEDMAAISGVVLLDGGGYDVPLRMSAASGPTLYAYRNAFSEDAAQQTRLSPVTHVGGPDAPQWLILHVDGRAETTQQARALGDALQAAGASVEVVPIAGTDHGGMNRNIGTPGDATTASIDAFLSALFE